MFLYEGIQNLPAHPVLFRTDPYSVTVIHEEEQPIGYMKIGTKLIKIQYNDMGRKEMVIADTSKESCAEVGTGGIYHEETDLFLCLDSTINKKITTQVEKGDYFMSLVHGLFGIKSPAAAAKDANYYVIVNIDDNGNVTLKKDSKKILLYRYTDSRSSATKLTIYDRRKLKIYHISM